MPHRAAAVPGSDLFFVRCAGEEQHQARLLSLFGGELMELVAVELSVIAMTPSVEYPPTVEISETDPTDITGLVHAVRSVLLDAPNDSRGVENGTPCRREALLGSPMSWA